MKISFFRHGKLTGAKSKDEANMALDFVLDLQGKLKMGDACMKAFLYQRN